MIRRRSRLDPCVAGILVNDSIVLVNAIDSRDDWECR